MGLGLKGFLNKGKEKSGGKKYLDNKEWFSRGDVTIWLSTKSDIAYPVYSHSFFQNSVIEDDKTGEEKPYLRFRKFVSSDEDLVNDEQHFRDRDTDLMRTPPVDDPFLLLREWLRVECEHPLHTPVFQWHNPQKRMDIVWTRGELSRLEDRGKDNWGHSLDTKMEYFFVCVQDDKPGDGLKLARVAKSLGDSVAKVIDEQIDSEGDDKGNPQLTPYAIKLKKNPTPKSPNDTYSAARFNRSKLTDEIRSAIESDEFPDPSADCVPGENDKEEIRAAMADAAQIDLPWDLLFPEG